MLRIVKNLKISKGNFVAAILGLCILFSIILTYCYITSTDELSSLSLSKIRLLINLDIFLVICLILIIGSRLFRLYKERRKGIVGSFLQTKIVIMFSLVAIVPTTVMAVFSVLFFNIGIQSWFDDKVGAAIDGSVVIAESYLEDHKNIIKEDIRSISNDISSSAALLNSNNKLFNQVVSGLAKGSLSEVVVFTREHIIARSDLAFSISTDAPSEDDFHSADLGNIVILHDEGNYRVRALVRLDNFLDAYLLVGRLVDPSIINYVELTKGAANQYRASKKNISKLQVKFLIVFIIMSLLLLLVVMLGALSFAVNLVTPVKDLLFATRKVKEGDLSVRVNEDNKKDEITALGIAFNKMAEQLEQQRIELASAQRWAAWSDVARRIAHEIKNPLTPILLATERLNRKFLGQVEDKANFEKYIKTIANNVNNIGQMVEEFANFARLPAPIFRDYDICSLINEIIFSRKSLAENIIISSNIPKESIVLNGDAGQISRVFINLIKNAEEAIEEARKDNVLLEQGIIKITLEIIENKICRIKISDNGKGFDVSMMNRLTEPYVTTKSKGTGLGLAIVKKIIEDHKGTISFSNNNNNIGACVTVDFYVNH